MMKKIFTTAIVREIIDKYDSGNITYSKMVELFNAEVEKATSNLYVSNCFHQHIILVTETPTDGNLFQANRNYVMCAKCKERLPINFIERRDINVPLLPDID